MLTRNRMKVLGLLATALLVCGSVGATTVVETFTYSDGDLASKGGIESGWVGSWAADPNTFTVSSGVATATNGSNILHGNKRTFSTSFSVTNGDPTIWLSWDMNIDFAGTDGYDYIALIGSGGEVGVYGRPAGTASGYKWSALEKYSSPYYVVSDTNIPDDAWSSVCVKIVPTGDGIADVTMWVNPNYSLTEDDPSQVAPLLTFTSTLGVTSATGVQLKSRSWDANVTSFDNIRVSDDFSLFVPEPTTMGLLAVGALALLKRRRR